MGGLSALVSRFDKGGPAAHDDLSVTRPLRRYRVLATTNLLLSRETQRESTTHTRCNRRTLHRLANRVLQPATTGRLGCGEEPAPNRRYSQRHGLHVLEGRARRRQVGRR